MIQYTYTHQGVGSSPYLKITPWYKESNTHPPFDEITNIILNDIFDYTTKYQIAKVPQYNIRTMSIVIHLIKHDNVTIEISNKGVTITSFYFTKVISLLSYTTIADYMRRT